MLPRHNREIEAHSAQWTGRPIGGLMNEVLGYLTRSTGIVATLLVVAALVWGFFFSARTMGNKLRPAWWLDLHNWLGGLALIFTGAHVAAAWLDSDLGIGMVQILVPGKSIEGWPITWGVLAMYILAAVVFTTWPRRLKHRAWWRVVHLTSVAGTAFAFLHTFQLGSDVDRFAFQVGFVVSAGLASYGLWIRIFALAEDRGSVG